MEGLPPTFSTGYFGPPQAPDGDNIWTYSEEKIFENALVALDMSSPDVYEQIQARLPGKSIDQIKRRMEAIIPQVAVSEEENTPTFDSEGNSSQQKVKRVRWTEEEHNMFLVGLEKYGKGNWDSISMYHVPSKTTSQVASHGQKYFRRIRSDTPAQKRRSSIHDIRMVDSHIVQVPPRPKSREGVKEHQGVSHPTDLTPRIYKNSEPAHDEPSIQVTGQMHDNSSRVNPHPRTCNNSSPEYCAPIIPNICPPAHDDPFFQVNGRMYDKSSRVNPHPWTCNNSSPEYRTPIIPNTSPMYPEMRGPSDISQLVNSTPSTNNNSAINEHAPFSTITNPVLNGSSQINPLPSTHTNSNLYNYVPITNPMLNGSSRINPLPSTHTHYNPCNNAPITPTTTPVYPKMPGGPSEISQLVSSPPSAYNNSTTNAYAAFSPITSPIFNGSNQINPPPSAYNNSNPDNYAAITPITTPMYPVDQEPPYFPTLINSPFFAYRDSILNDNAPFIPFTSPMNPQQEERLGNSHLFNSYPNNYEQEHHASNLGTNSQLEYHNTPETQP